METRLRVRFADNTGFVCAVPAGATLDDFLKFVGERLGLRPEETATLCCRNPRDHRILPDAALCAGLENDDPDAPNLLRTVFVDVFAPRPKLLAALWGVPGSSERFSLPALPPKTTDAFSRLTALSLVARALSGCLFRGPDEARVNAELVSLLALYACGRLLQTSNGLEEFQRFVRLAGLGLCAVDPDELRRRHEGEDSAKIRSALIVSASALEYFCAHPLGTHWVFRAELDGDELVPPGRVRLPDGRYDFRCTRALGFLCEHGVDARGVEGGMLMRVRHAVGLHVLADAVFIEEEPGRGMGICSEHPRDLLATLEKWVALRKKDAMV